MCAFTLNTNQKGEFFHREKKSAPVRLGQERQSSFCNADALHESQCPGRSGLAAEGGKHFPAHQFGAGNDVSRIVFRGRSGAHIGAVVLLQHGANGIRRGENRCRWAGIFVQIALQCPAEPVLVQAVCNKAALKMAVVGIGEIILQKMKIITQTEAITHRPGAGALQFRQVPGHLFCGGVVFMSGNIGVQKHVRHNAAQLQCQAVQTPRPVSHQMSGQQPVAFFVHRKKHLLIKMKHSDLYRKRGGKKTASVL